MKKSLLTVFVLSLATLLVAGCMNNNVEEVVEEVEVVEFDLAPVEEIVIEEIEENVEVEEVVVEEVEVE